jgi:3-hydroxyacyl-CoA dehydrogenase/enoyl-CoA hydratase/3-hydroxybutyryl-CoA epimerase
MATQRAPTVREFRLTETDDGIIHLVFDMPDRSMNVFSNAAIHEVDAFANWLASSTARGVVISSGKSNAFCAGADLGELGVAYDMIMGAPRQDRSQVASDHFAPIGRAFRKLETAGKPVAVAIHGLALGGGCEFALACHHRVLSNSPNTALGLPESLVGLFPGAGGTQRMPRLVGLEASLPILLEGARIASSEAIAAGVAHQVVSVGKEVAAAEEWVRSATDARQPWDRPSWKSPSAGDVAKVVDARRTEIMVATKGHYPALLAILDCLDQGLTVDMNEAIRRELSIFAELIKRPEPRNMINSLFLAKQDFDRQRKGESLPPELPSFLAEVRSALERKAAILGPDRATRARSYAAFGDADPNLAEPRTKPGLWLDNPQTPVEVDAATLVAAAAQAASNHAAAQNGGWQKLADYAAIRELGFPAYLGGPYAVFAHVGRSRIEALVQQ